MMKKKNVVKRMGGVPMKKQVVKKRGGGMLKKRGGGMIKKMRGGGGVGNPAKQRRGKA